jgi:hypothetical protein
MSSRGLTKVSVILALGLFLCARASAQYGGGPTSGSGGSGGGMSTGSSGSMGYSSGSGKAIGIGVGVAAATGVGIALLVHHHHSATRPEASLTGCTQSVLNGISLKNETDNLTYTLISSTVLQAGERVELKGVMAEEGPGVQAFRVKSVVKSYGTCGSNSAATPAISAVGSK